MAVQGLKFIKDTYGIEINEIINDGDSRSYNACLLECDWWIKKY